MTDARAHTDLLLVASFGGHFEELLEMRSAWGHVSRVYATTARGRIDSLAGEVVEYVPDCHGGQYWQAMRSVHSLVSLVRRHRPKCIVTTGALPGFLAVVVGRLFGASVIWVDSVANADELSKSGRWALRFASAHLVQWPKIAQSSPSAYLGNIL